MCRTANNDLLCHFISFLIRKQLNERFFLTGLFILQVTKDRKYSWCTIPAIGNLDHETVLTVPGKVSKLILRKRINMCHWKFFGRCESRFRQIVVIVNTVQSRAAAVTLVKGT